jgi:hypothetical protein
MIYVIGDNRLQIAEVLLGAAIRIRRKKRISEEGLPHANEMSEKPSGLLDTKVVPSHSKFISIIFPKGST